MIPYDQNLILAPADGNIIYCKEITPGQPIFSKKKNPEIDIKPAEFPIVYIPTVNSKFLIGWIAGAGGDNNYCIAKFDLNKKTLNWKILCKKE